MSATRYLASLLRPRNAVVALALLAALPYLNALSADFVFDDIFLYERHSAVQGPFDLRGILSARYWEKLEETALWRPLTTLSFAVDHAIAGNSPAWPHGVNVALHVAITLCGFALTRRLCGAGSTRERAIPFIAAALFAVHPLHTEAVTWISGRAELLAALGGLCALLLALRPGAAAAAAVGATTLLAMCSKESAAVTPFALLYLRVAGRSRPGTATPGASALLASAGAVGLYALLRFAVLGTWSGPQPRSIENPLVGSSLLERLPSVLEGVGRYLSLLIWPGPLTADYSAQVLALAQSWSPLAWAGLLASLGLLALAVFARRDPLGWGAGFAIFAFSIASNVAVVIGTIFAERLFYLPSYGLLVLAAAAGTRLAGTTPIRMRAGAAVLLLVLAAGGARTWARNADYRDALVFASANLAVAPRSAKMHYNHAIALANRNRPEEALAAALESEALVPGAPWNRITIANALYALDRHAEAEHRLREDLALDPANELARGRLQLGLEDAGRFAEAERLAEGGLEHGSDAALWIESAARAAQRRGDLPEALRRWTRATELLPISVTSWTGLGSTLLGVGQPDLARRAFERALLLEPRAARAMNGLAWLLLESGGNTERAGELARRAVEVEAVAPHYDTLARAELEADRCPEARAAAAEAVRLAPSEATYAERLTAVHAGCR